MAPPSTTIDKELERKSFITETVLAPQAAAAATAPEVHLAPVSKKGRALVACVRAGTVTMIRPNHRRREGGRGGGRVPTCFVWTTPAPPWPHQGASRHDDVFKKGRAQAEHLGAWTVGRNHFLFDGAGNKFHYNVSYLPNPSHTHLSLLPAGFWIPSAPFFPRGTEIRGYHANHEIPKKKSGEI